MQKEILLIFKRWKFLQALQLFGEIAMKRLGLSNKKFLAEENYRTRFIEEHGFKIISHKNFWNIKNNEINVFCRKFSSDIDVFNQIFIYNEFKALFEVINENGLSIQTIIDAGSNIGLSTIKFVKQFAIKNIVSIEPDTSNYNLLKKNLFANHIKSEILKSGVWNKSCRLYFDRTFRDGKEWSISLSEEVVSDDFVDSVSINDIATKFKFTSIDLLKIDIEGGERYIFNEKETGLEFLNITKVIALEIHDEFNIQNGILKTLEKRGFKISKSGEYIIGIKY